jgi:hypothetical protein
MALITGTPVGTLLTQEDLFIEGAPTIFIQQYEAPLLFSPDSDSFYWGLTGTTTYPVYEIGCVSDVSFTEDVTLNDVLCDNVGVKDTIQQRNYVEFQVAIQSMFPIKNMAQFLNMSAVTQNSGQGSEKSGIGKINNARFWHVWAPAVYNLDTGDYVAVMLHRCKFVESWTINMTFGQPWQAQGIRLRAFVDSTVPAAQQFGMILRVDPSVI